MSEVIEVFFEGEFPGLNEYILEERRHRMKGAAMKKEQTMAVKYMLVGHHPINEYPVVMEFTWYCKDRRRDPDNIAFARKFILDGMVDASFLKNDTMEFIIGFSDRFVVDPKKPGVTVVIRTVEAQ